MPARNVSVALEIESRAVHGDENDDSEINGKPSRRLSPEYYAWLRSRMVAAKKKLPPETFAALKQRFLAVRKLALDLFGEDAIRKAVEQFNARTYSGPGMKSKSPAVKSNPSPRPSPTPSPYVENYEFPKGDHPKLSFTRKVLCYALSEVDRIRDEALAAGWTETELYQNRGKFRFPIGAFDYGIVCYVDPDQRLGQVTPEKIELICRGGHSLYFRSKPGMRQSTHPGDPQPQPNPETMEYAER